jgi:excisionase family DNA binding protein
MALSEDQEKYNERSRAARAAASAGTLPEVMDIYEAAAYFQIDACTLAQKAKAKKVPAFRMGTRWRFKKSLLDKWMEKQSRVADPAAGSVE